MPAISTQGPTPGSSLPQSARLGAFSFALVPVAGTGAGPSPANALHVPSPAHRPVLAPVLVAHRKTSDEDYLADESQVLVQINLLVYEFTDIDYHAALS